MIISEHISNTPHPFAAKIRKRLFSDHGTMGFVMALFLFFGCGMITCTWNTYLLSKEKMRIQAAADAAALEHALWQARAMNLIQDLNNEIYDACHIAQIIYGIAGGVRLIGRGVSAIPFYGWFVWGPRLRKAAEILEKIAKYIKKTLVGFMVGLRTFYKYSPAIGYVSAQQMAKFNGAKALIPGFKIKIFGADLDFSPYAIGFSLKPKQMFVAPVKEKDGPVPLKKRVWVKFLYASGFWRQLAWDDVKYLASDGDIKTTMWIVTGKFPPKGWISAFDNLLHINTTKGFNVPIMAYACAKAYSGDLIARSHKERSSRPSSFGTGANAVLVSIDQMASEGGPEIIKKVKNLLMMYH